MHVVACLTSRGNYARIGSVLHELDSDPEVTLDIIVAGASLVRKYGTLPDLLREDGLEITETFQNVVEGGNTVSMAKTTGLGMMEFANALDSLAPDAVITIADRYESMSVTLAASYLNLPVVHIQGGELTGSIDDRVRHATTKLSDYHFVATDHSSDVVRNLGEPEDRVFDTGCPSIDLAADIEAAGDTQYDPQEDYDGVGSTVDVTEDYLIVQYHPVPTEYQSQYEKTWELIDAVRELDKQVFWFWPNMDAGTDQVSKALREFRGQHDPDYVKFYINLRPRDYLTLVANSACMVGNSSVAIRECSFLGQPTVNVGSRQQNRERADNVLDTECEADSIVTAVESQVAAGSYERSTLYGSGDAGEQIASILKQQDLSQKPAMTPDLLKIPDAVPQY